MYFEEYKDVIDACRFCFMCRHLDPVGNVSFRESDIPRGRALIADRIQMDKSCLSNSDYIDTMYRSALSAANRSHCVSDYDENGLVLALRRDIVEAGYAPQRVKELADKLATAAFSLSDKSDILYFGAKPELYPDCAVISGGDPGKALEVLGFVDKSVEVFERFKALVCESGCSTLIVAEPSAYHFLAGKLDAVEVVFSSNYLLKKASTVKGAGKALYLESDFLKNYCKEPDASRELLKKCGWTPVPFGTNVEESTAVGEGALVFDDLNPELCELLCARVVDLAGELACKIPLITASNYVKRVFGKYQPEVKVLTVEESRQL